MSQDVEIRLKLATEAMREWAARNRTLREQNRIKNAELAKLRADNKALLEALKAFMGLPHLFDDMCVDERPDCKVCAAIKLARAAIEHSEPQ